MSTNIPDAANAQASTQQLARYLRYVRRMGWYPGTILTVMVVIASLFVVRYFTTDKLWDSETVILLQSQNLPEEFVKATVDYDPRKYINTLARQVMSRTRLEKIIKDHDLYPELRRRATMDEVVDKMRSQIDVQIFGKESFKITYSGADAKTAQAVCAQLAQVFIDENVTTRIDVATKNAKFLAEQAEKARVKLSDKDDQIRAFKEKNLDTLPTEKESRSQNIDQLTVRLNTISEDIRSARTRKMLLQPQLSRRTNGARPRTAPRRGPDPAAGLKKQLAAKQAELNKALLQFQPSHPLVVRLKGEISTIQRQIAAVPVPAPPKPVPVPKNNGPKVVTDPVVAAQIKAIDDEIAQLTAESNKIKSEIKAIRGRQDQVPRVEMDLSAMERDREILQEAYKDLLRKKEEAERAQSLEDQNQGAQFKILDKANRPERPSGSGLIKLGIMGLVLGLALGLGLALLRVLLDTRIHEPEDLQPYLDAEVLVVIPSARRVAPKPNQGRGLPSPGQG